MGKARRTDLHVQVEEISETETRIRATPPYGKPVAWSVREIQGRGRTYRRDPEGNFRAVERWAVTLGTGDNRAVQLETSSREKAQHAAMVRASRYSDAYSVPRMQPRQEGNQE